MDNSLPPGFELEQPAPVTAQNSSLPPGFELEQSIQPSAEQQANTIETQDIEQQSKYGGTGQQLIAGAEAVGKGLAGPLATGAERLMGVDPEDIRGREEANPITSLAGNVAGLVSPIGQGALLGKIGGQAAQKIVPRLVEEGVMAGIKRSAVKVAAENALYQAGDETSKMIMNDPNQSVGTAITNVGLATALGGALGGGLGAVSPLWKAAIGNKASQFAADFKGRMNEHLSDADRVGTFTSELGEYHKNIKSAADEVYGPTGIKAQEISKLIPEEITPKIMKHTEDVGKISEDALKDMAKKQVPERYMNKFINDVNTYNAAITKADVTPGEIFNASQDLKQTLQGYSKGNYGPFAVPSYHEAYDFLNITKNLGRDIRMGLEDSSVWGKAAERQQSINKAFKDYLPALQDFEKKFTTELNGERVIDPGKANTYFNQLGKPNAELKQNMLKNFLDASDKYQQVIHDTHANLGVDSPIQSVSTNAIRNTLKDMSHGAKLADMVVKRSGDLAGKTLGGVIGGVLGHLTHLPGSEMVGTIVGEHALGSFLGSILPSLTKPLLEKGASGEGLKAATEYGLQVAKGRKLTDGAITNLFKSGVKILPDHKQPDKESRKKLETSLLKLQQNPDRLVSIGGSVGHYLPDHAVSMGSVASNVVNFLNSLRPQDKLKAPLDSPKPISKPMQAQYNRALDIAEQPLVVLESIKDHTVTSHDVIALQHMYPDLYRGLQQKIMNAIVDNKAASETIPYKLKQSLSIFMAQPLDSSMNQLSIMAAQPVPEQPQSGPQQPQPGKKPSQAASNNMIKGSKSMQTAAQASEAMHSTGKA